MDSQTFDSSSSDQKPSESSKPAGNADSCNPKAGCGGHRRSRTPFTSWTLAAAISAMLFATMPLTACATTVRVKPPRAAVTVRVTHAPPAVKKERVVVRPSKRHVWVGGRWTWKSSRWVWVSGAWKLPPRGKKVWIAPKYEKRKGHWVVVRGYWR